VTDFIVEWVASNVGFYVLGVATGYFICWLVHRGGE